MYHIASGTKVSIGVGSTCDDDPPQNSVVMSITPVTLTCCIEDFPCPQWTISWYRNSSNVVISHDQSVTVDLIEIQETFICVVRTSNDIPYPLCYEEPQYQGVITLQGIDIKINIIM